MGWLYIIIAVAIIGLLFYRANMSPEALERAAEADKQRAKILCPHCQERGGVTWRTVPRKKGISGGKATGAILTGGVSMFATGLSRKENTREMSCSNCGMRWDA